jgi:drug/metabolite transporter (DMT)-like permease
MPQGEKRDSSLRNLGFMFGAITVWAVTYTVASRMLSHYPSSATFRAAAVAIGVIGFVLWQLATAKLIRKHDEFTRRVHMIAVVVAFAATGLFIFTTDLLQRAGFIDYILLRTIWLVMLCTWWLAIMGGEWYYRR